MPDGDGEYRYRCTECDNGVWTGMWREAVTCPECSAGKLISDKVRER